MNELLKENYHVLCVCGGVMKLKFWRFTLMYNSPKTINKKNEILGDGMCDHCKTFTNQGKYINRKWSCPDCIK